MNEPFSFGAPERQRFTMQFGYNVRPSFWQNVQSNAHLVIAAIGTASLLGVAAVALWLCVPGNDRQAVATAAQAVPTIPVKTTKIAPAAGAAVTVAAAPQAARKADAVSPANAAREATIPALASSSPRWTAPGSETAQAEAQPAASDAQAATPPAEQKPTDTAFAEPAAESNASTMLSQVAAPAPAGETPAAEKKPGDKMDGAKTAAIPEAQPQLPDAQPADNAAKAKPKAQKISAAANGRTLRAVTMRSGPKKGAAAIVTIPAKAPVQVVGCKQWCEIIYNGKHGWIYKSYVKKGA